MLKILLYITDCYCEVVNNKLNERLDYCNNYFQGFFWIAGNQTSKVTAILYVDEEGKVTISSLQPLIVGDEKKCLLNGGEKIATIFGYVNCLHTNKIYSVKLYDVCQIHYSTGALTKFKYKSSNCFISQQEDEKIENLSFNSIMISSEKISNWIPTSGLNYDLREVSNANFEASVLYRKPKEIQLFESNDCNIYFCFRASIGSRKRRTSYIKEDVFLNIETKTQLPLNELYEKKTIVERLLSIILSEPLVSEITDIQTVTGHVYSDVKKIKNIFNGQSYPIDFETFCQNSQGIFKCWFDKQEQLELFIKNFFAVYGRAGILVENRFLTYISILENYHKNNTETSARLVERLSCILTKFFDKEIELNINDYSKMLKETRNSHVHTEEKEKAFNIKGIYHSNRIIEVVIRDILLKELGLQEKEKLKRIRESITIIQGMMTRQR